MPKLKTPKPKKKVFKISSSKLQSGLRMEPTLFSRRVRVTVAKPRHKKIRPYSQHSRGINTPQKSIIKHKKRRN